MNAPIAKLDILSDECTVSDMDEEFRCQKNIFTASPHNSFTEDNIVKFKEINSM